MKDCVFCKIVKGEIPCYKVWEDDDHIAFLSLSPNTPGFTVVATKKHFPSYAFENSDKVLTGLILATKKVAQVLDKAFDDVARTGMFFEGFGVDHLHSKLSPMHGTSGLKKWKNIESKKMNVFFEKYPGYLSSHDAKRVDDKDLNRIAKMIRGVQKRKK